MKISFTNKLRILFTLIIVCGLIYSVSAQSVSYELKGKEIVRVKKAKQKAKPIKTDIVFKTKDSIYPVYKSVRGSFFVLRKSRKSGKIYKQYLKLLDKETLKQEAEFMKN